MNPRHLELNSKILKLIKAPGDQSRIVATAVALAVSSTAPLPSSQVESLVEYYSGQVLPNAMLTISEFGETVVFASKTALEYTQTFWKMRYYAAHPASMLDNSFAWNIENMLNQGSVDNLNFGTLWNGGVKLVSTEMDAFMNQYKKEILILSAYIMTLLTEVAEASGDIPAGTING